MMNQTANVDVGGALASAFSNIPGFSALIQISKAVGIAVLVYIIFLIIKTLLQIGYNRKLKSLANNVEEINQKMDILVGKKLKKK